MTHDDRTVLKPGLAVPIAVVVLSWILPPVLLGAARKTKVGRVATHPTTASIISAATALRRRR